MPLSVALCTCNGARYLAEQLRSVAAQSRPPDELIACDDCSDDETVNIIRAFAATSTFPVRLHVNEQRLGWTKNFETAIGRCQGDLIALADQDDVWQPDKLARLAAAFANARVGAVISDAEVVDEQLRPLGYRLWQTLHFDHAEQQSAAGGTLVESLLKRNVATGATMAFRARFKDLVLPIPSEWRQDAHDAWIALLIAAVSDVAIIDAPLIQYRQHARQQIGGRSPTVARALVHWLSTMRADFVAYSTEGQANCAAARTRFSLAYDRLVAKANLPEDSRALAALRDKIDHFRVRAALPKRRWARLRPITREWLRGRYQRYSRGMLVSARISSAGPGSLASKLAAAKSTQGRLCGLPAPPPSDGQ